MAVDLVSPNPQKNLSIVYDPQVLPGTIAVGATVSSIYDTSGWTFAALETPGTLDSGTVTFRGGDSLQSTFRPMYDQTGTAIKAVAIVGQQIVNIGSIAPVRFIQLVTAGTGQTVAQTINLLVK